MQALAILLCQGNCSAVHCGRIVEGVELLVFTDMLLKQSFNARSAGELMVQTICRDEFLQYSIFIGHRSNTSRQWQNGPPGMSSQASLKQDEADQVEYDAIRHRCNDEMQ